MAVERIEVTVEKGKAVARVNGKVVHSVTDKEPGVLREKIGLTHGQKGHNVYTKKFGTDYYLVDVTDADSEELAKQRSIHRSRK